MSVTVVNDWKFKPGADIRKAKAAAAELVEYFKTSQPGVQLSLWVQDQNDPLHHFHITVFDDEQAFQKARESEGISRFVGKFYPHVNQDTHEAPLCDVWLLASGKLQETARVE